MGKPTHAITQEPPALALSSLYPRFAIRAALRAFILSTIKSFSALPLLYDWSMTLWVSLVFCRTKNCAPLLSGLMSIKGFRLKHRLRIIKGRGRGGREKVRRNPVLFRRPGD